VELRDLHYMETLAAELHFGRAATRLHLSQPALSQALARLEREVGCPLVERDHRGVTSLTNAGRVLLSETHGLQKSIAMACEMARRAGRGETGTVAIGFVDAATFDVLPPLLQKSRERYPAVSIICHQLKSSELARGVEVGQLDLAFLRRDEPPPGVELRTVVQDRICVLVSRSGPLARLGDLSIIDLANQDFILPVQEDVASVRPGFLRICHAAGFSPRIVAHATSIQVIVDLVAQGMGVAFAARSWARHNPNVVVQELRDVDEYMDVALAFRPEGMSSQAKNLLDLVFEDFDSGVLSGSAAVS
jgi:DNA-binding transcriptional LysR family regulator